MVNPRGLTTAWDASSNVEANNRHIVFEVSSILHHFPKLTSLKLGSILTSTASAVATHALSQALQNSPCELEELDYSGNSMRDIGAKYIANYIQTAKRLRHVNVRKNYIGQGGVKALMSAIETNSSVRFETLKLGANVIIDEAMDSIQKAMIAPSCQQLKFCDLTYNFLTHEGVMNLAQTVQAHPNPALLVLFKNNLISNDEARQMFTSIVSST